MSGKSKPITFYVNENGCHICNSHKKAKHFGFIKKGNGSMHRFIYEKTFGINLPKEIVVMHICDNPACINIEHLKLGTHKENRMDCVLKNRHSKGERHGLHKLTNKEVFEIRNSKEKTYLLANKYKVSRRTIWAIKKNILRKK